MIPVQIVNAIAPKPLVPNRNLRYFASFCALVDVLQNFFYFLNQHFPCIICLFQ